MNALQRAQLKQSEIRSAISAELDKGDTERDTATLETLTAAAKAAEIEYRAALVAHEETAIPDTIETSEGRELTELRSRVKFGKYVQAAMGGGGVMDGPELEYNQELELRADFFPLDILTRDLPGDVETRASRDGDAQSNQLTWIDRLFHQTAASMVGVTMRSVSPGVASIPVTTAGGTPSQRGRTEAAAESTYTVAVEEIKPSRNAVHGIYSMEDDLRLPGLADAIQRDMRMAMTERIDHTIFVGDSGANENAADITGLQTAGIAEVTLTQANKVKGDKILELFANLIDGQYAAGESDLRIVSSVGSSRLWMSTIQNVATENQTIAQFLRASGLTWTTRGGIDTNTADGDFGAYVGLGRGIAGAGVAAVWNQAQLIRDPYSSANKGEVQLTLSYYWGLKFPRTANFKRLKYVS